VRGATDPGGMPGDDSWRKRSMGMRTRRVGDLGLVAPQLRNVGMRTRRVEFALSVTLV